MHRFQWDMHLEPIVSPGAAPGEPDEGAVPHRTYPSVNAPWAPAGSYTVRLIADGKTYTQPMTVRLDPRVKTPAVALTKLASLSQELYDGARASHAAYLEARAKSDQVGASNPSLKAQIDSIAPAAALAPRGGRGGGGGRAQAVAVSPTLESVSAAMLAAAMSMQGADVAPTARQVDAAAKAMAQYKEVMRKFETIRHR
ncbi:hypothetical protein BH11GEM2_BH11GEM2_34610 [soil metagenome]